MGFQNNSQDQRIVLMLSIGIFAIFSCLPGNFCKDTEANKGVEGWDFEWNVAVGIIESEGFHFLCGGVIIEPWKIVTSASCFDSEWPNIRSTANSADLDTIDVIIMDSHSRFHSIHEVIRHPGYTEGIFYDDIVVLKPMLPLKFHSPAASILDWSFKELEEDGPDRLLITNWFFNVSDITLREPMSEILPCALVKNDQCEKSYRKYFSERHLDFNKTFPRGIDSSLICTKVAGFSECVPKGAYQLIMPLTADFIHNETNPKAFEIDFLVGTRFQGVLGNLDDCEAFELPVIFTNVGQQGEWINSV